MQYSYKVNCKNCGVHYKVKTEQKAFQTFQVASQRNNVVNVSSFIHNCDGHEYGVGEIIGMEFKENTKIPKTGPEGREGMNIDQGPPPEMPPGQLADTPPGH